MDKCRELEIKILIVSDRGGIARTKKSFWHMFRLTFVIFFLYLLGDAIYRWNGFSYYASFSEFLPSVALISVLWSVIALFVAILLRVTGGAVVWFCNRLRWNVRIGHVFFLMSVFVVLGAVAWIGKRLIWHETPTSLIVKISVFLVVAFSSIFIIWLLRNRAEQLMEGIQERITPLVWLFGIWLVISIPLVTYHAWIKQPHNTVVSQQSFQSSVADKNRPNIILVTFDALTARDMSVYGYHRPTTPFITEWAKGASIFTRAEAASNVTTPTTASLMTGKRLWTHQTYHLGGIGASKPLNSKIESLPFLLKKNGYYNMAFIVNPHASVEKLGIEGSFEIAPIATGFSKPASLFGAIDGFLYKLFGNRFRLYDWVIKRDFIMFRLLKVFSRNFYETEAPPEEAFKKFLVVLGDDPPEPFFAWIHLYPPHDPYLPPVPYMGMFKPSSELKTFKTQEKERKALLRYSKLKYRQFPRKAMAVADTLRTRYDEFIRYCDKQFESFIAKLAKKNKLKNTLFILSSDHGESFEHAYIGHSGSHLYEQVTHIPLIIMEPEQTEGRIINGPVEQVDIPATILDFAKIKMPSWMEGRSLLPLMKGKKYPFSPIFSMTLHKNPSRGHRITKGTFAVWERDYKLIHYIEEKKSLLFNLKEDPDELNNLFDKEPEIGQRLLGLIQDNLKKANERITQYTVK